MKTYYLHTASLMDATDNGSASVVLHSDHLAAVKELERERDAYKLELDQKRQDGHMIVEHGYRMAAEHEVKDLTYKLQKAVEALKSVKLNYTTEHLNATSCDNVGDKIEATLKEIGVES